jgi:hypothetical protein
MSKKKTKETRKLIDLSPETRDLLQGIADGRGMSLKKFIEFELQRIADKVKAKS